MTGHISDIISLAGVDMTFKPNKDSEPLSEASPGPHDLALAKALEHELRAAGAFEGESEDAMRAKALSEVGKIVTDWAAGFYERMGIPVPGDSKKMAMILPFGSYALGVHSTDSDIDVLAVMPNHVSRHDFLAELEPIFKQHPSVEKLSVVPEAFVPVIKFHWEGVDIDLSFAQLPVKELPIPLDITDSELLRDQKDPKDVTCLNGPRVTYEILRRVRNAEHFRTFLRSIKLWARRKGIYSNIVGFPGGVAWAIMCANVCQLYPNLNPPMLLEKFFFLYLNWNFDNAIKIASVDECRAPAGAMYMPQWSPSAIYRPLQIITPTYPVANATFNACHSTVAIMHSEIALGHNVVQGVASAKHDFSVLFTPSDFFAKYSNYVCVDCSSDAMDDLKPFYGYLSSQVRLHEMLWIEHRALLWLLQMAGSR